MASLGILLVLISLTESSHGTKSLLSKFPLFIRRDGQSPISIEANIVNTVRDLFGVMCIKPGDQILFGNVQIKDPDQLLSDLGIGSESVIDIKSPSDLYQIISTIFESQAVANKVFFDGEVPRNLMIRNERDLCTKIPKMFACKDNVDRVTAFILFDKQISNINLAALAMFRSLDYLSLQMIGLTSLDLTPLSVCTKLTHLEIKSNNLEQIDLFPLYGLDKLEELNIAHNKLTKLDLSPLAQCKSFRKLTVSDNELKDLDLMPLVRCPSPQRMVVFVNNNPFTSRPLNGEREFQSKGNIICPFFV